MADIGRAATIVPAVTMAISITGPAGIIAPAFIMATTLSCGPVMDTDTGGGDRITAGARVARLRLARPWGS